MNARYLGMRPGDLDGKPYARFWNPTLAPLSRHAADAVAAGPLPPAILPALADAPRMLDGSDLIENGWGVARDGSVHIAVRTEMPSVTPEMIDWWFAWHSDEPERYKLWHPRAHVHARWRDGVTGERRYVGRVSEVDEYIGDRLGRFAIGFAAPETLGLHPQAARETMVCARVGLRELPVDGGWLVHHVRRVDGGSEMRSRFWIGGAYVAARLPLVTPVLKLAARWLRPRRHEAEALLVHCAQEMAHLASFLPSLFAELGA